MILEIDGNVIETGHIKQVGPLYTHGEICRFKVIFKDGNNLVFESRNLEKAARGRIELIQRWSGLNEITKIEI